MNTLGALLKYGVSNRANDVALKRGTVSLTFLELERLARALAIVMMRDYHVTAGDRVIVVGERRLEVVVAAIAIWKCGAVYVPIDPADTGARSASIIASTAPKLICASRRVLEVGYLPVIYERLSFEDITNIRKRGESSVEFGGENEAAVLMHTSGSTGKPKGVILTHHNVISYFSSHNSFLGVSPGCCVLSNGPFHFDVSIQDTFLPLFFGARAFMHSGLYVSSYMIDLLITEGITHMIIISSVLALISNDAEKFDRLRESTVSTICVGGEPCDPKLISKWMKLIPNLRLQYGYGPTEFTCVCLGKEITKPSAKGTVLYPIGKPFAGVKAALIDRENGELLDGPGQSGILALSGPQLMKGYWNDAEETARCVREVGKDKYYITGDICRLNESLEYCFIGRDDGEVKINGRRIHLNEIRDALLSLPLVTFAMVDVKEESEKHIVAVFCVGGEIKHDAIEAEVRKLLPEYMVPNYWCLARELPTTSTGKADERALAAEAFAALALRPQSKFHFIAGNSKIEHVD
jgi:D-alanine--poly(phosphoribitol) ligase subunit 1